MGDPFSVAGTAIGITPLGIQTFQILHRYYSQYEGFHDDIDSVLRQADGLCGILESVQSIREKIEVDQSDPSSQLLLALKTCKEALERLRSMLDKCNTTTSGEGISARLRDASKRILWPFRKETLREIQSALSMFQNNLILALQSAGLNGMLRRLGELQPVLHNLQDQTSQVEKSLICQTKNLEVLQQEVEEINISQKQYGLSTAHELAELRAGISQQTQALRIMCNMLVRSRISKDPTTIPPSLLVEATQIVENASPRVQESVQRYVSRTKRIEVRHRLPTTNAVCGCRFKKSRIVKHRGWLTTLSEEEQSHKPDCPLFNHSEYSKLAAAQCSRRGTWNSVAPLFRCRTVVPKNSGVFKLLNETASRIWNRSKRESVDVTFSNFMAALPQSLIQTGHPTCVDETGTTVFAAVIGLILDFITYNFLNSEALCSLLDTCILNSIPHDEADPSGLTPVMLIQENLLVFCRQPEQIETLQKVLLHLIRRTSSWEVLLRGNHPNYLVGSESLYRTVSELLKIEEVDHKSDDIDPMLSSILRRSIEAFDSSLKATSVDVRIQLLQSVDYSTPLASWSAGVDLLLSRNYHDGRKGIIDTLWEVAVSYSVLESIEILLMSKQNVEIRDWEQLNVNYSRRFLEKHSRWSKVFYTMACRLSDGYRSRAYQAHEASMSIPEELHLFDTHGLTIAAAEGAWTAGFCDLGFESLWKCSWNYWSVSSRKKTSPDYLLLKWLLEHGADPFQTHPRFLTTPLHLMFRGAPFRLPHDEIFHFPNEIDSLMETADKTDSCNCRCSVQGCFLVGCAVSKHSCHDIHLSRQRKHVFSLTERNREALWMISAIVRVLTFEELSLTHTCCYRVRHEIHGTFSRPTITETEIIQDLERTEIDQLEALVEEFEHCWINYDQSFEAFISKIWAPRMRRIHAENEIDRISYETKLSKIGVVVEGLIEKAVPRYQGFSRTENPFHIAQESYAEWLLQQEIAWDNDKEDHQPGNEDTETEGLLQDDRSTTWRSPDATLYSWAERKR